MWEWMKQGWQQAYRAFQAVHISMERSHLPTNQCIETRFPPLSVLNAEHTPPHVNIDASHIFLFLKKGNWRIELGWIINSAWLLNSLLWVVMPAWKISQCEIVEHPQLSCARAISVTYKAEPSSWSNCAFFLLEWEYVHWTAKHVNRHTAVPVTRVTEKAQNCWVTLVSQQLTLHNNAGD